MLFGQRGIPQTTGLDVFLVSHSKGKVKSMPGFDIIREPPSFIWLSSVISIGCDVKFMINLITSSGCCELMQDEKLYCKMQKDLDCHMEEINGLFMYETKGEHLAHPTAAIRAGIITKG